MSLTVGFCPKCNVSMYGVLDTSQKLISVCFLILSIVVTPLEVLSFGKLAIVLRIESFSVTTIQVFSQSK